ncbi:MAG TPA: LLM class F420-dependent oxidoreductase [Acidimicrobiales bacterium]|nr:LLM class F420-dependent oxidoreductase [Acidimicrobiales bacterium]
MDLGFSSMNTPEDPAPDVLARALEERGFESFWIGEHSHIPTSRKTPYPAGGELPPGYLRMMDPLVSLAVAACATERLVLGTAVALPLEHDLFAFAKSIATLDRLSGGRLQLGVGVGWNQEELANCRPDLPWAQRYRALAECVGALRALWTDDEPEVHGRFFDFDPVWSFPKPRQQPHPPILCGTGGRLGTAHAVEWADGWMPMDIALGDVARKVGRFREIAVAAGRPDMPVTIVAFGDPAPDTLRRYRDLGVRRVVLGAARAGSDDPATTLPFVDRYAALLDELR